MGSAGRATIKAFVGLMTSGTQAAGSCGVTVITDLLPRCWDAATESARLPQVGQTKLSGDARAAIWPCSKTSTTTLD
jgi:hypothetical protein